MSLSQVPHFNIETKGGFISLLGAKSSLDYGTISKLASRQFNCEIDTLNVQSVLSVLRRKMAVPYSGERS